MAWQDRVSRSVAPPGVGYLGLDERTGVISDNGTWRVAGEGAAYWFSPGSSVPVVARDSSESTSGAEPPTRRRQPVAWRPAAIPLTVSWTSRSRRSRSGSSG